MACTTGAGHFTVSRYRKNTQILGNITRALHPSKQEAQLLLGWTTLFVTLIWPSQELKKLKVEIWNFVWIMVVTDVMDGRRCSNHSYSTTVDKWSKLQVKELKKLSWNLTLILILNVTDGRHGQRGWCHWIAYKMLPTVMSHYFCSPMLLSCDITENMTG